VLFYLWKRNVSKNNIKKTLLVFIASVFAISFINEGIQFFIPGRTFNFWDIFYNITGMLAGMLLWLKK
jgi:VanZ family protein